ncbi:MULTISPECIES: hypothetical protein [unclassified Frankia]|uniref:hypothetical protein n=1 Tax=unclassified Frankia TaxID=2632575 RepID=UPI002AD4CA39|nr:MULTISPECIES: hypothetical protein [unclassified Frankia]
MPPMPRSTDDEHQPSPIETQEDRLVGEPGPRAVSAGSRDETDSPARTALDVARTFDPGLLRQAAALTTDDADLSLHPHEE